MPSCPSTTRSGLSDASAGFPCSIARDSPNVPSAARERSATKVRSLPSACTPTPTAAMSSRLPSLAIVGSRYSSISPSAPVKTARGMGTASSAPSTEHARTFIRPPARSNPTRPKVIPSIPIDPTGSSLIEKTTSRPCRTMEISIGAPTRNDAGRVSLSARRPPPKSDPARTAAASGTSSSRRPPSKTIPAPFPSSASRMTVASTRKSPSPIDCVEY